MQNLLSGPGLIIFIIISIILVLLIVGGAVLLIRRRRNQQISLPELDDDMAPTLPMLGGAPIDYTALPFDEEPKGLRERFNKLAMPAKILIVLVPILVLLGLIALVLSLLPASEPPPPLPTEVPVTMEISSAAVARAEPLTIGITVRTTGLADGTLLTAELLEDGQPFGMLDPALATGEVRRNRAEFSARAAADAPQPQEGRAYSVIVQTEDGTISPEAPLVVPEISGIADAFFGRQPIAVPNTPTSPPAPTTAPSPTIAATAAPEPTATAAAELPTGPQAGVLNGGNLRSLPIILSNNVIGGINAGETVQLIARTPNGLWYSVRTVRDELGWVAVSLLNLPPGVNVEVAPIVTVFVNGAVFEEADSTSTELDRVNRDEIVELTGRNAAGDWYQIRNVRAIEGWVPANLLGIPPEVAAAVPEVP